MGEDVVNNYKFQSSKQPTTNNSIDNAILRALLLPDCLQSDGIKKASLEGRP
jgi:hypothetical protein